MIEPGGVTTGRNELTVAQRLLARVARLWLTLRYQRLDRRHGRLVLEHVEGTPLLVLPQVFNPVLMRSGAFKARTLKINPPSAGERVLDLGTGSGVGAVFAARYGARVTAVDINPEAVRCARINAIMNRLEELIEVREGDLFQPVLDRRFDLILFNPPFYRGRPRDHADRAWRGEGVFERFVGGLAERLQPGGRVLLVLSTDGDGDTLLALLQEHGFDVSILARENWVNEIMTAFEIRHSPAGTVSGR